jgi:hypothetical protein
MKKIFPPVFLLLPALLWMACEPEDSFPPEPVINEISLDFPEKLLVVNFTDGDGDYGLEPVESDSIFQDSLVNGEPNRYIYNIWIDFFKKIEGEFQLIETPSPFDGRLPNITPQGQNKQLRVKVTYNLNGNIEDLVEVGDTIRFDVRIVDRSLNISPIATTNEVAITN